MLKKSTGRAGDFRGVVFAATAVIAIAVATAWAGRFAGVGVAVAAGIALFLLCRPAPETRALPPLVPDSDGLSREARAAVADLPPLVETFQGQSSKGGPGMKGPEAAPAAPATPAAVLNIAPPKPPGRSF